MADPIFTPGAITALNAARKKGFEMFRKWRNRDSFKHLARLLSRRFETHEFLYGQDWGFLKTQADVGEALDAFFVDQAPLRPALLEALPKYLVIVSDAAPPLADLAEQVIAGIEKVAPEIWDDENDRVVYKVREQMALLEETAETVGETRKAADQILERVDEVKEELVQRKLPFVGDALPDDVRPYLERLATEDGEAAARLTQVILNSPNVASGIKGLVEAPQGWFAGSAIAPYVWAALGRLSAHFGMFDLAQRAFLAADAAGHPRRAHVLAKAAEAAGNNALGDEAARLLAQAESLDRTDSTVSIMAAQALSGPDEKLERLEQAKPQNSGEEAALLANRAAAHFAKREYNQAVDLAEHALELSRQFIYAKIVLAQALLARMASGSAPRSIATASRALSLFVSARESLVAAGRTIEALSVVPGICHASFVADEKLRAVALLEEIASDTAVIAAAPAAVRTEVADAAVSLQRLDIAGVFLPDDESDETKLTRASVRLLSRVDRDATGAASELDAILDGDGDASVRGQAALMRLAAAVEAESVEWSEKAEGVLRDTGHADAADGMRAQYLSKRGHEEEAENILLASQDGRNQELLVSLALDRGETERAVKLSEELLRRDDSPRRRLDHAEVMLRARRTNEASVLLAPLRSNTNVPIDIRDRAFYVSVREAHRARRYDESEQLADEWMKLVPEEGAAWMRAESLLWLSRYDEAVALVRDQGLEPATIEEARLLAHIYIRGLTPVEALTEIATLSDRFDRSDERLEGLVVVSFGNANDDDLTPELGRRGQESVEEFATRFPDSKAGVRTVTLEELNELLRGAAAQGEQLQALGSGILAGRVPVHAYAAATRAAVSTTWVRMRPLPIAFSDAEIRYLDLEAAEAAIGVGAVWDLSSLVVVLRLPSAATQAVKQALPRSVLAHAGLQDVDYAAMDAIEGKAPVEQSLAWDEEHARPVLLVRDTEEVAGEREMIRRVLAEARELAIVPDTDSTTPTPFDADIAPVEDLLSLVGASLLASLSVAARMQLALFSDDRVIRNLAREVGIASFGTVALLEGLARRSFLDESVSQQALEALSDAGAIELWQTPHAS